VRGAAWRQQRSLFHHLAYQRVASIAARTGAQAAWRGGAALAWQKHTRANARFMTRSAAWRHCGIAGWALLRTARSALATAGHQTKLRLRGRSLLSRGRRACRALRRHNAHGAASSSPPAQPRCLAPRHWRHLTRRRAISRISLNAPYAALLIARGAALAQSVSSKHRAARKQCLCMKQERRAVAAKSYRGEGRRKKWRKAFHRSA